MGFRTRYLADWRLRSIDMAAHITAAIVLAGPWWAQWLPDVCLPVLWTWSMVTDFPVAQTNRLLLLHRFFHTWMAVILLLVVVVTSFTGAWIETAFIMHWAIHLLIDTFTHD